MSGSGSVGCLGALIGLFMVDLLLKLVFLPLFGIEIKEMWPIYTKGLLGIFIVALVVTAVAEILNALKGEKNGGSSKGNAANDGETGASNNRERKQ